MPRSFVRSLKMRHQNHKVDTWGSFFVGHLMGYQKKKGAEVRKETETLYLWWHWADANLVNNWIPAFCPNGSASWRSRSLGCLLKGEPHLDLIAYSQVGYTNFCYKYCALMIDIAHGKETDQAKQMDFQLWSQKPGGKVERREGWGLVLSEWTNWSRTGGGRENMPPGEPQDPFFLPHAITSTTTPDSIGSFSPGLRGSSQLLCGSLFSTERPSNLPVRAFMTVWTVH